MRNGARVWCVKWSVSDGISSSSSGSSSISSTNVRPDSEKETPRAVLVPPNIGSILKMNDS